MEKRGKCLGKGVGSRLGVRARRDLEDQREAMVWHEAFWLDWRRGGSVSLGWDEAEPRGGGSGIGVVGWGRGCFGFVK